jgi:HKD family nuclease
MELIIQPFSNQALGDILKAALNGELGEFHTFQAAVAFVKNSGVQHIQAELRQFTFFNEKKARLVVGIDHYGSSQEGLEGLLQAIGEQGEIWINHSREMYITFHPKVYLFEGNKTALLIIGSGNLTEGGLYTNDEASSLNWLDFEKDSDKAILDELRADFDAWCNEGSANARKLDQKFLAQLVEEGYILTETTIQPEGQIEATIENERTVPVSNKEGTEKPGKTSLFGKTAIKRSAPKYKKSIRPKPSRPKSIKPTQVSVAVTGDEPTESDGAIGFVMILLRTDVGTGQTTPGTSRRSPEIFVPLVARNYFPEFWGWPNEFIEDSERPGKFDRLNVKTRIGGETVNVNMMTWPVKRDFRLRSEALRSAGNIGDILRIEKTSEGQDFSYYVEIIPQGTSAYQDYLMLCINKTPNSTRVWGYYS